MKKYIQVGFIMEVVLIFSFIASHIVAPVPLLADILAFLECTVLNIGWCFMAKVLNDGE